VRFTAEVCVQTVQAVNSERSGQKPPAAFAPSLLGRAGARALQDRIARIALRRGPHSRCVLAAQGYRRNSLPLSKCSYAYGDVSPRKQKAMKAAPAKKPSIRIAVVESDPMRFVGFRALLDSEPDFELISASLP